MALELTLMVLSGAGMIALLVHKHLEISRGLETRAQNMREKADPVLHTIHHSTGRFVSHITFHNALLVLNQTFVHIVRFFMDTSHKVHKVSSNLVEKASKKTEDLSRSGAASFYLKQIKDAKDNGGEGK
jgi:hypothetical protein